MDGPTLDGVVNLTQALDYASPPPWLNAAIQGMTGCDVLATLVHPFDGDWERIARYSDALGHVAACLGETATEVQTRAVELGQLWTGNAAEAAFVHFSDAASGLSRYAALLQQADQRYTALAVDVRLLSEQLQGLLQSICDQAAVALIQMAVGTALVETGAGAVDGYSLATVQIAGMGRTIARASLIIQAAALAVDAGCAGLTRFLQDFGDPGGNPMPARAYEHPVVVGSRAAQPG